MLYSTLVEVYEKLEKTTKRLEKTLIVSELLNTASASEIGEIILLIQGKIFPSYDERKIGIAARLVIKAISTATGISTMLVEKEWKKTGDLGISAENLTSIKKQETLFTERLSVKKVFNNIRKIAGLEGSGSIDRKIQYLAELLTSASPKDAKYIIRTILEEMRVGIGEGTLRDAIAWAFFRDKVGIRYERATGAIRIGNREIYNQIIGAIQNTYDITNDFGAVAEIAKSGDIHAFGDISITPGRPIKVMLALKVNSIEDGFKHVGMPAEIEYKLDGFRMQIHKNQEAEITLYTRRLENVTAQFPDVIATVKKSINSAEFIIDSEAVGYSPKTGKYLPFQSISQRIKRKYRIEEISKKFPVELNVFDMLSLDGKSLLNTEFRKRREHLEKIVSVVPKKIVLARNLVTSDVGEAEKFYKESIEAGNEGVMLKNLNAPYKPGARVGYMVKYKSIMESLDLVIISAEWGEGKRANLLSSYTVACVDDDGNFLEVGKVSTGLKEKEEEGLSFGEITEELKPLIISEHGKSVIVKPKIVIEVSYEEIQKSPTYKSGFALRFPRIVTLRSDRAPEEATTIQYLEDLYYSQKKTE